jgi:hypothetical protein
VKDDDAVVVVELSVGGVCVMVAALAMEGVMTNMVERIRKTAPSHEAILVRDSQKVMCET